MKTEYCKCRESCEKLEGNEVKYQFNSVPQKVDIMVVTDILDIEDVLSPGSTSSRIKRAFEERRFNHKERVYFTSIGKCLLPGEPTPKRLEGCLDLLTKEIRLIKPKIILGIGNTVLKCLTGHSGITKYAGQIIKSKYGKVICTVKPSAVDYNPKLLTSFTQDIELAINYCDNTSSSIKPIIHIVLNKLDWKRFLEHMANLPKENKIALDLETTTYDYWRPETKVMCMAICGDGINTFAIPLEHPQSPFRASIHVVMGKLSPYFTERVWIGNNWKYDLKWMLTKYGIDVNFGPDNMLMSYATDENIPHGLKFQAKQYFKSGDYDKEVIWPAEFDPVKHDINKKVAEYLQMDLHKLLKYNALDAFYSWNVYPVERAKLLKEPKSARIYKHLLEKGNRIFTYIESFGMWVDPERLAKATLTCQGKIEEQIAKLNKFIPEGWCENNLGPKQLKQGFNWNSPKQVGELFFQEDGINLPMIKKTKSGAPSTDEATILELNFIHAHPVLDELLEYRKWSKFMSTYLRPWAAKLDENSRLHPSFLLHGTVTGRLSGKDGVHQVPRDKFIRSIIGAPPGWSFFEIDGSQIELRVVSVIAQEPTMLRVYITGGDIHRETASQITGKIPADITSKERKDAKAVNFGFVYGMGWKKFKTYAFEKYGIRLTDSQAKLYRTRYFEKYHRLPDWHEETRQQVRQYGCVLSPLGRKRRLPHIDSNDHGMAAAAEREGINSPVQSMGSDIILAAFIDIVLNHILPKDPNFETIRPVGMVHDAQYYEIRNDMIDFWVPLIKSQVDDVTRLKKWFGYKFPIPMIGDCKIGNHWGDAQEWEHGTPLPYTPR